jgi:tetratricopeptide (TPR) repeat protein
MVTRFRAGFLAVPTLLVVTASLGFAQGQSAPPQGGGGAAPAPAPNIPSTGTATPGRGTRTPTPTPSPTDPTQRTPFPEIQRPIFLSGKVVMEDGTPPPEPVTIERVCNGQQRPEGYTDSKGRFSIQLGQNTAIMADASVGSSMDTFPGSNSPLGGRSGGGMFGANRGLSERDLIGCELRAVLAGYRSEVVMLSGRRTLDNPDVGTIILRRLGNVEGLTYSATSLLAPKDAKKAYEKGLERAKKDKMDDARKEFEKAVQIYPKYAAAWYELGVIHQRQQRPADAKSAYEQSLAADSKFVKPYLQMALLAAGEQNWQQVADTTDRVIRLNPVDFPQAFFFNSVANYNLKKFDAAEKSAAEAVKLDTKHQLPKAQHILGVLMAMRNELGGAAENLRSDLKHAPSAPDVDAVSKQLAEIERRLGSTSSAQQQQQ